MPYVKEKEIYIMKDIILTSSLVIGLVIIVSFLFPAVSAHETQAMPDGTTQAELCIVCTDCIQSAYLF